MYRQSERRQRWERLTRQTIQESYFRPCHVSGTPFLGLFRG